MTSRIWPDFRTGSTLQHAARSVMRLAAAAAALAMPSMVIPASALTGISPGLPPAPMVRAESDLDWLLFQKDPRMLLYPNREPDYHLPGDHPKLPAPLPPEPGRPARPQVLQDRPSGITVLPPRGTMTCEIVRQRIVRLGYSKVRGVDCVGAYYGFAAEKDGTRYRIAASAKTGRIVWRRKD